MEFDKSPLTDLPPKPIDFDKKDEGLVIGLEPIEPNQLEKGTVPKSNIDAVSKIKGKTGQNKAELQTELEGLQSKLNSVHNLINFIDKKHDSGKLDDKSYKKQTRKLNKDLEQTQKRIEEIKDILG
jgi:peptidoglycan hydrolase CwlO-like protein